MGFYAKDEATPRTGDPATADPQYSRRKYKPRNAIPPILTVGVGHRFYSPALGRWMSRDPLRNVVRIPLYVFCRNGPISRQDLLGLAEVPGSPYEVATWRSKVHVDISATALCTEKKGGKLTVEVKIEIDDPNAAGSVQKPNDGGALTVDGKKVKMKYPKEANIDPPPWIVTGSAEIQLPACPRGLQSGNTMVGIEVFGVSGETKRLNIKVPWSYECRRRSKPDSSGNCCETAKEFTPEKMQAVEHGN